MPKVSHEICDAVEPILQCEPSQVALLPEWRGRTHELRFIRADSGAPRTALSLCVVGAVPAATTTTFTFLAKVLGCQHKESRLRIDVASFTGFARAIVSCASPLGYPGVAISPGIAARGSGHGGRVRRQ